ncbi:thiamine phosphate synthase [Alteromonas sp. 009811495]|uniref:thiamine phosphate synthase n=1 Tax=Alteromonas sp. 009811495 TaxID=3002962 RepID=UPI00237E408C|nr:thiamine phosphate synthase [Alteromonas sp. 009811495]WDT86278.1 thiamine phosphate synthase [Alteromonas sp. 009811495]
MTQPVVNKRVVWCVGGIDSSGGAGISRDAITLADLDVHACLLTTQLTVQSNTVMLSRDITKVSALNAQWQVLAQDALPSAIKIGAIANDEQAQLLCTRIQALGAARPFVVWDPVLTTSSGGQLSELSTHAIMQLLQTVDVVTPNTQELGVLAQHTDDITCVEDALTCAKQLITFGAHAVLVKGGHLTEPLGATLNSTQVFDIFVTANYTRTFALKRNSNGELRGTGCMLASALCGFVLRHYDLLDALTLAIAYVNHVRQYCSQIPGLTFNARTIGFPQCPSAFPDVYAGTNHTASALSQISKSSSLLPFAPLTEREMGIYPVVDSVEWLKELLPTGVKIIQLRVKHGPPDAIRDQIKQAIDMTSNTSCQLFINDHWEWAIALGAYGVHLGQEDLENANLHAIQQAGLRLGISTHGYEEIQRIKRLNPSYIALGHIFPTTTKDMPSSPQGVSRLANYVSLCEDIPTVAIGGITRARINTVAQTHVNGIAVVTAIIQADNPKDAFHALAREAGFAY